MDDFQYKKKSLRKIINQHACRADKNPYRHDRRADKNPYRHDRRTDKNPYRHNRRADSQCPQLQSESYEGSRSTRPDTKLAPESTQPCINSARFLPSLKMRYTFNMFSSIFILKTDYKTWLIS